MHSVVRRNLPLVLVFAHLAVLAYSTSANGREIAVLHTEFASVEGYVNGELQFQSIANGTPGTWLGHLGAEVDTDGAGRVERSSDPRQNLFHRGVTGGIAGGNGTLEQVGTGFEVGDQISIQQVYSFEVDDSGYVGLLKTGVRQNYVGGGYESLPELGIKVDYSLDSEEVIKIYSNLTRSGASDVDDSFAFVVDAESVGISTTGATGEEDYSSDQISISWTGEYLGSHTWQSVEVEVENLDTLFKSKASEQNTDALETLIIDGSGDEAFLGVQLLQGFSGVGTLHSIAFSYRPVSGAPPGDFDGDFDVDGNDLLQWQLSGAPSVDLLLWKTNYGVGQLFARGDVAAVPEMQPLRLVTLAIVHIFSLRCPRYARVCF